MHVPGWHKKTAELQRQGKLQMVGIIQEQHPDRCRLFMQWKKMDWPIMVDSLDLLQVSVVPITLAIDEHGIIRHILRRPNIDWLKNNFLNKTYAKPAGANDQPTTKPNIEELQHRTTRSGQNAKRAPALRAYANALATWGTAKDLNKAIKAYRRAIVEIPGDGWTHFRLAVTYRKRFDTRYRRAGDFQQAVDHWTRALDIDPNNYIWRRRIQQYGPRLMKPYPFYDWVPTARKEILARGDVPIKLTVEPGGAEFARPSRQFKSAAPTQKEPDPKGRIMRDTSLIQTEITVVPPIIEPGRTARVHLVFRPNDDKKAHWNNEAGESILWINPPPGWKVDSRLKKLPNDPKAVSREPRTAEVEVQCPKSTNPGTIKIPAYALYYVCEDADGKCLYRRQGVSISLKVGG